MLEVTYQLHIEPGQDGKYIAYFPALPGCQTQGSNLEEVIGRARDALQGFLECLRDDGELIPVERSHARRAGFDLPLSASLPR